MFEVLPEIVERFEFLEVIVGFAFGGNAVAGLQSLHEAVKFRVKF